MPTFKPDTCNCLSIFTIVDDEMIGELVTACEHHANFNSMIADNRKKNIFLGNIENLFEPNDDKYITFSFDENHELIFIPHGYTEEEIDILNYTWSN